MYRNIATRVHDERLHKYNKPSPDIDSEDNIYYNVLITNDKTEEDEAEYNVTSKKTIVENPQDYYLTITRFEIPPTAIPILIFNENIPAPGEIDQRFKVSAEYDGNVITKVIDYIRLNPNNTRFKGVYQYQALIEMINVGIRELMVDLWNTFGPLPVPDPNDPANPVPEILFFGENERLTFRFPVDYLETNPDPVKIYFNNALFSIFQNFKILFFNYDTDLAFQIRVLNQGNNYVPVNSDSSSTYNTTFDFYDMKQDSATFYLWYDITDIVVATNMPVNQEILGNITPSGAYQTSPILTDISTSFFGQPYNQRANIVYIPSPQYRLVDMLTFVNLDQISFKFFYRTKTLQLIPLLLAPGETLSMKLLFVKKNTINRVV